MSNQGSKGSEGDGERARQEGDIALRHSVAVAEHALAAEAVHLGRVIRSLGLDFDPLTFVVVRVLEESTHALGDPWDTLSWFVEDGVIERSVAIAAERLSGSGGD